MMRKPFRGIQLNKSHPLARGLVGCWLMNEGDGGTLFDYSGNGNNGPLTNASWNGQTVKFDGDGDYINVPYSSLLLGGIEDFSIAFTLKYESQAVSTFVDTRLGPTQGLVIFSGTIVGDAGTVQFEMFDIARRRYRNSYGPSLDDGLDHSIIFVFDRDGLWRYYLDGVQVATQNIAASSGDIDSGEPYRIMGHIDAGNSCGKGCVTNWYHYNRALSPDEAKTLYSDPYAMFEPPLPIGIFIYFPPGHTGHGRKTRRSVIEDLRYSKLKSKR